MAANKQKQKQKILPKFCWMTYFRSFDLLGSICFFLYDHPRHEVHDHIALVHQIRFLTQWSEKKVQPSLHEKFGWVFEARKKDGWM